MGKHTIPPTERLDRGANGLAMRTRPREVVAIANGSQAIGQETVDVMQYGDTHLIDRMHKVAQLSDKQHDAGKKALGVFHAAGMEQRVSSPYRPRGLDTGVDHAADEALDEALKAWRGLLMGMPINEALVVEKACLGEHPGVSRLATLQCGLDRLAAGWGL